MLITTARHTPADLIHWMGLEAQDAKWAKTAAFQAREQAAVESVRSFVRDRKRGYYGVSWGKDSTVLAHLCWRAGVNWPAVHIVAQPWDNPHCPLVRDRFLADYPIRYEERIARYSGDLDEGDAVFFRQFAEASREHGACHLSGIRAQESGGRKIRMRNHGLESRFTCAPIGWWSDRDVFAYLYAHRLPVHPDYAYSQGGVWPREHLRVDGLCGDQGVRFGRAEWERLYYGPELRALGLL